MNRSHVAIAALALLMLGVSPAHALYKVIAPDGKITYTDRPESADPKSKVISINAESGATTVASGLPLELRQVATKYPVALYVGTGCAPCDQGRAMLVQRGIPFAEKVVISTEDSDALERLSGGREAPTLMIGQQSVRGYSSDIWASYLDLAGYPRQSVLPANYQRPPATPVVQRQVPPPDPQQRLEQSSRGIPVETPPPPGGIKF